jgi:hypothetical protein
LNISSLHCPSQDLSDDTLSWGDLSPANSSLSGEPWVHRFDDDIWSGDFDEITAGNGVPDSDSQLPTFENEGFIFPDTPPSNWNSGVGEGGFTSCDVSPFLVSEPWIKIISFAARESFINTHSLSKSGLRCPASYEDFIALDHDVDASPDLCIPDDADGDAVMLLALE